MSSSQVELNLTLSCLCRLWDHIRKPYMPKAQQRVPFRALCKLLPDLINGSAPVAATAIGFLRSHLGRLEYAEAVLGLLNSIAPALRCLFHLLLCISALVCLPCHVLIITDRTSGSAHIG